MQHKRRGAWCGSERFAVALTHTGATTARVWFDLLVNHRGQGA